jgi:orotidine-5'-phosphate decarboxylase
LQTVGRTLWEINHPGDLLCLALDVDSRDALLRRLEPFAGLRLGAGKIGHELYEAVGPDVCYDVLEDFGLRVFRDSKTYDIPNTIGKASKASVARGAALFNVPAATGRESLEAAAVNKGSAAFIVVTVLTAMDDKDCEEVHGAPVRPTVVRFARMAWETGADGVVCAVPDLEWLDVNGMVAVTPGVRFAGHDNHDQKRVATPGMAAKAGSGLIVMGRDLKSLDDYNQACDEIAPFLDAYQVAEPV